MAIPIPTALVEFILLGPLDDRRQLQDSPILGDVWVEFGRRAGGRCDLLISPYKVEYPGTVAAAIVRDLGAGKTDNPEADDLAHIAYLQGILVARLTFAEVLRVVVPKTNWWTERWPKPDEQEANGSLSHPVGMYTVGDVRAIVEKILVSVDLWNSKKGSGWLQEMPAIHRFVALTTLILWAGSADLSEAPTGTDSISHIVEQAKKDVEAMSQQLVDIVNQMVLDPTRRGMVWQVSLNRSAMPALNKSIPAVKADAAHTLFKVNCSEIGWAVLDSGIDGAHPAFRDDKGDRRVRRSFDFQNFRRIVSLSNSNPRIRAKNVDLLTTKQPLKNPPDNPDADLERLADDARDGGPIQWELIEKFVEIDPNTRPLTNHGTHVAGIIGANRKAAIAASPAAAAGKPPNEDFADGMCPDINLYDFRVLAPDSTETEFVIIAALQFIRYLNARGNLLTIHGANLSLSIPHDVRNFACGRTPICDECERLVASGVVVVTAAGNHGYKSFQTKDGSYDSYAAFSITDPGNADGVITVGATHRFWPHTYGVSFFSSRGPTGDGRLKPDLVAPGERIRAPLPGRHEFGGDWGDLDGTSMAAPHVSGAAAMLMARYSELVRQPQRLKRILCDSATDLARERSFQGHGMLDVLRALQSI